MNKLAYFDILKSQKIINVLNEIESLNHKDNYIMKLKLC